MNLEWILMAEGFGSGANGALTAIAVNQNVLTAETLPTTTKRGFLAHFVLDSSETEDLAALEITVSVQVVDPSGEIIIGTSVPAKLPGASPWPDLPVGVDVVVELPLRIREYGTHEIRISTQTPGSEKLQGSQYLYVREPLVAAGSQTPR